MLKFLFVKPFALTLVLAGFAGPGFARTSRSPQETAAPPAKNDYVSSATCGSCHEDLAKKFAQNPHQILETSEKKGWKDQSCESCHGPWAGARRCRRWLPDLRLYEGLGQGSQ